MRTITVIKIKNMELALSLKTILEIHTVSVSLIHHVDLELPLYASRSEKLF